MLRRLGISPFLNSGELVINAELEHNHISFSEGGLLCMEN
jgi:hypothetical protein